MAEARGVQGAADPARGDRPQARPLGVHDRCRSRDAPLAQRQAEGLLLGQRPEDVADHLVLVVKSLREGVTPPGDALDLEVDAEVEETADTAD